MNLTQKLTTRINELYKDYKEIVDNLDTCGPRGGSNAAYIDGWTSLGNTAISRAANLSDMPTLNWYDGFNCRPTVAIPQVIAVQILMYYHQESKQPDKHPEYVYCGIFTSHWRNPPSPFNPDYDPCAKDRYTSVTMSMETDGYYDTHTRDECKTEWANRYTALKNGCAKK